MTLRSAHPWSPVLLVLGAAALLAGCGGDGGKKISDVRSCLEGAKLQVAGPDKNDAKSVEDGVSATSGIGEGFVDGDEPLLIVVAARVKDEKFVGDFSKNADDFRKQLSPAERKEFQVRTGDDGRYVWVVAGDESSKRFRAAEDCVKP